MEKVMGGLFFKGIKISQTVYCMGAAENKGQRNLSNCISELKTEK